MMNEREPKSEFQKLAPWYFVGGTAHIILGLTLGVANTPLLALGAASLAVSGVLRVMK